MTAQRTDRQERRDIITVTHDAAEFDPGSGYARISDAVFTRTGVFKYLNEDGTERFEYRPSEEVFRPETLDSMRTVPLFNDHPPIGIDETNVTAFPATGTTGEAIKKSGSNVTGPLTIWDGKSIRDARNGKTQLSMGYQCDVIEEVGISSDGIAYTHIQRNILYNHVAQVDQGRAGNALFRLDHGELIEPNEKRERETKMDEMLDLLRELGLTIEDRSDGKSVKIGGDKFPLENKDDVKKAMAAFKAWATETAKANAAKGKRGDDDQSEALEAMKADNAKIKAERDALKQKLDARGSEEEKKKEQERIDAMIEETIELREAAKVFGVKDIKDKNNEELRIAICVADGCDEKKLKDEGEAYIKARFDLALEGMGERVDTIQQLRGDDEYEDDEYEDDHEDRGDSNDLDSVRDAMINRFENAYRKDRAESKKKERRA